LRHRVASTCIASRGVIYAWTYNSVQDVPFLLNYTTMARQELSHFHHTNVIESDLYGGEQKD
jgi:hypothetical protein